MFRWILTLNSISLSLNLKKPNQTINSMVFQCYHSQFSYTLHALMYNMHPISVFKHNYHFHEIILFDIRIGNCLLYEH